MLACQFEMDDLRPFVTTRPFLLINNIVNRAVEILLLYEDLSSLYEFSNIFTKIQISEKVCFKYLTLFYRIFTCYKCQISCGVNLSTLLH